MTVVATAVRNSFDIRAITTGGVPFGAQMAYQVDIDESRKPRLRRSRYVADSRHTLLRRQSETAQLPAGNLVRR